MVSIQDIVSNPTFLKSTSHGIKNFRVIGIVHNQDFPSVRLSDFKGTVNSFLTDDRQWLVYAIEEPVQQLDRKSI